MRYGKDKQREKERTCTSLCDNSGEHFHCLYNEEMRIDEDADGDIVGRCLVVPRNAAVQEMVSDNFNIAILCHKSSATHHLKYDRLPFNWK